MPMKHVRSGDGTLVAFDRLGEGPSVILVGGALSGRSDGAALADLLAARYSVITYDRRGRGDSGDTLPYAVEREIEDLAALIGQAGGHSLAMGHSSGAVLALRAAAAGLPITGLAMYEPPFILDGSRAPIPADYVAHLAELTATARPSEAVEYFMIEAVGVPAAVVAGMKQSPMWTGMESVAHTLEYDGRVMGDTMHGGPAALERWSTMPVPTLVLDGGDSPPWMRAACRSLAGVLPNAEYRTLAGQTHSVAPEVLAPALEAFFAGLVPPTERRER
jgi:pimeloyl-ACP methyl ester carboxylesterase